MKIVLAELAWLFDAFGCCWWLLEIGFAFFASIEGSARINMPSYIFVAQQCTHCCGIIAGGPDDFWSNCRCCG